MTDAQKANTQASTDKHFKTIFVTGGAGFIGSNFIHYYLKAHKHTKIINIDALTYAGNLANLTSVENDERYVFEQVNICDAARVRELFVRYSPDAVINFAAESHVDRSILDPQAFVKTNVLGATTLLNCAREAWLKKSAVKGAFDESSLSQRFLQVSTDEVYGSLSLDEPDTFFTEKTPLNAHSPYSASKASADLFVLAYGDTFGLPVLITRCSNNYGPYQFPEKLIPLMIHNALNKKALPIYGDGKNIRDWLYVEDHCRAIDLVLHQGRLGEVYNVGGHNERANNYIVSSIIEYLHDSVDSAIDEKLIQYVEDRAGHDRRYGIDPQKIASELDWEPETSFEVGIKKTIQWYLDHQDWVSSVLSGEYQSYYQKNYGARLN